MSNFDTITNTEGKEYLVFDSSELFDDSQMGNKSEDFEILKKLGEGGFGKVFKVRSKINNKVYAMKMVDLEELKTKGEKAYQLTMNEIKFLEVLVHPHIIKYYKNFNEGKYLYIIIEFAPNGDIEGFIEAHKRFNKHIPEEEVWNILLQCMGALEYVHSTGVIHRDIKPANLLMDNNMIVKLGDFGASALKYKDENSQYLNGEYCPFKDQENMKYGGTVVVSKGHTAKEILERNEYDQKVDVYSMGVSFFELCYFHSPHQISHSFDNNGNRILKFQKIVYPEDKNAPYSKELLNIIDLMLEEDKDKRKTSKEILRMIQDEFSKKYVKNSSIDSIVRCLYSFTPLKNQFLNIPTYQIEKKPITKAFIQCLKSFSDPNLIQWINSIGYFRQSLCSINTRLESTKEIEPRFVFAYFIKELHKELNNPKNTKSNKKHLIISGEESSKTSKFEVMLKLTNDLSAKFNSIISESFSGLINTTNRCEQCKILTYSFNSFYFVTFNLENILKNNMLYELNIQEQFIKQKSIIKQKWLYCGKCLNNTVHSSIKGYYSLPQYLIISIQRGITYNYKNPIYIAQALDLTGSVELQYSKKQFYLVSLLGRKVINNNEIFFSIVNSGNAWYYCEGINIQRINFPTNFNSYGDILMLFYM